VALLFTYTVHITFTYHLFSPFEQLRFSLKGDEFIIITNSQTAWQLDRSLRVRSMLKSTCHHVMSTAGHHLVLDLG
jgi:hypothetical protein